MPTNQDKMTAIYTLIPALLRQKHNLQVHGYEPDRLLLWEGWKPDPDQPPAPGLDLPSRESLPLDTLFGVPIVWVEDIVATMEADL